MVHSLARFSLLVVLSAHPLTQVAVAEEASKTFTEEDSGATVGSEASEVRRASQEREEFYDLLLVFADTIDQIDRNYVERVSRRELLEAAIEGAMKTLDPYSDYIAPEEFDEFRQEVDREFAGIGIQIGSENQQLKVISPLVGSPAYRAGILAGDLILAIDGEATKEMRVAAAVKRLKGPPGSEVTLTVFHPFQSHGEDVTLIRERVKVDTVMGDRRQEDDSWQFMYDDVNKLAYVRIAAFGRETAADLKAAMKELQEDGMRALILDLRFNSGGLLRAAIEVADMFLRSGVIVGTEGRNIKPQVWQATEPPTLKDFPMAVLVNQFSASASEIVAAALQDHRRATVIGQRTFGKASIQNVVELEDGRSALKLTTGSYQRPNGQSIHRFPEASDWGVQPDAGFEVKLSRRALQQLMIQRQLRDVVDGENEHPADRFEDAQLRRALGYLQGVLREASAEASAEAAK